MKKTIFLTLSAFITSTNIAMASGGNCGTNCTWDLTDGTLTISGTGAMKDYDLRNKAPWFASRNSIKSVIVEEGITNIGERAFSAANNLNSITLPDSVTSIGASAFYGAGSLAFTVPNTVTSIGLGAFRGTQLTQDNLVNVNPSLLLNGALAGMHNLTSFTIPEGTTSIGNSAFFGTGLTSITIPDSVTSIGAYAFDSTENLTSITIPDSVTSIGNYAFANSGITSLEFLAPTTNLNYRTLVNIQNLQKLIVPEGMQIDLISFLDWSNLEWANDTALYHALESGDKDYLNSIIEDFENAGWGINAPTIECKGNVETCKANLYWPDELLPYFNPFEHINITEATKTVKNADGSTSVYTYGGKLLSTTGKRIYTVEEATRLSKPTGNTLKLRYK